MKVTIKPLPKQEKAWEKLQDHITKYLLFGGGAGGGKAQTLNSLVLTKKGFVKMGSLRVGDKILTPKNKETEIIAIHPQGLQDIYEIEFIDGAKTKTTKEHLWDCWKSGRGQKSRKARTTEEIKRIKNNVIIPLSSKLEFGKHYSGIDSYFVGVLLGDGGLTKNNITFTTDDEEIFDYWDIEDNKIVHKKGYQYSIYAFLISAVSYKRNNKGYPVNQLLNKLKELKLIPINCDKRFIPDVLKFGSLKNRIEVLKGLMDTDGTADKRGHCSFTSKSQQLALDVQYIVRSIGGKATLRKKKKYCWYESEKKECICYEIYIQTKNNKDLFKLKRKKDRVKSFNGGVSELGRRIKSIKLIGKEQAQCITIEDKKGLYITDDFIITHNSWLGCEWLMVMCYMYPESKWFIGRKELTRLMKSSYETFKKVCLFHKIPPNDWKLNGQYNYIEFFNKSKIDLLDLDEKPSDPMFERFGSSEYTGGWIEEAAEVKYKCFDVLKSRIGRHKNKEFNLHPKLLLTANPTKNWLKRIFYKRWKNGTLPKQYTFIQSLYRDNFYTSDIYGENLNEIDDLITRQRLRDGNWDYDEGQNILINTDAISDLFTNTIEPSEDRYLVGDIARFGSDKIVLMCFQGLEVYKIIVRTKQGTDVTADLIKQTAIEEQIPFSHIVVDEDGVGGGVVDQCKGIKGFVNNSSPIENSNTKPIEVVVNGVLVRRTPKENYQNLRSQCYYMLADYINTHKIAIKTYDVSIQEAITEELEQIIRNHADEDRKLSIVPKEDIKEAIGRSPDYADTLMMRMYFELNPQQEITTKQWKPNFN